MFEPKLKLLLKVEAVDELLDGVACGGVHHSNCEDAVNIDVVGHEDLLLASWSRVNATNNDFFNLRVVCCIISLTFKHSDCKICLVVFVSLESGLFFTWNSRVVLDNLMV